MYCQEHLLAKLLAPAPDDLLTIHTSPRDETCRLAASLLGSQSEAGFREVRNGLPGANIQTLTPSEKTMGPCRYDRSSVSCPIEYWSTASEGQGPRAGDFFIVREIQGLTALATINFVADIQHPLHFTGKLIPTLEVACADLLLQRLVASSLTEFSLLYFRSVGEGGNQIRVRGGNNLGRCFSFGHESASRGTKSSISNIVSGSATTSRASRRADPSASCGLLIHACSATIE